MKGYLTNPMIWPKLGAFILILAGCTSSPSIDTYSGPTNADDDTSDEANEPNITEGDYIYTKLTNVGQHEPFGEIVKREYIVRNSGIQSATMIETTNLVRLVVTNANYVFVLEALSNSPEYYVTMGVNYAVTEANISATTPLPYQYSDGATPTAVSTGKQGIEWPDTTAVATAQASLTHTGDDGASTFIVNLVETPLASTIYTDTADGVMYNLDWTTYVQSGAITTTAGSEFVRWIVTTSTDPAPFLNKDIRASTEASALTTTRSLVTSSSTIGVTTSDRNTFIPNLSTVDQTPGSSITVQLKPTATGPDDIMQKEQITN